MSRLSSLENVCFLFCLPISASHTDGTRQWCQLGMPMGHSCHGVSFGCLGQQMGAKVVLARDGCKQDLRARQYPQAPSVHPPNLGESQPAKEASGTFQYFSGGHHTLLKLFHPWQPIPARSHWVQTGGLLPPLPPAKPYSVPVPTWGHTQPAEMGFLILTHFSLNVHSFPLSCSWTGFSFLLGLLDSYMKLERPF